MKVAVFSPVPTCGKSILTQVLGSVFSRSQGRDVAIFSTGDAKDNIELVQSSIVDDMALNNPYTLKAIVDTVDTGDEKQILNYGNQAGDEHVYIFDILSANMAQDEKEDFFLSAIKVVPVDLTLIEIKGDIHSEFNERVLKECDCSIMLVEQSMRGYRVAKELISTLTIPSVATNRAFCVANYDQMVCSEKRMCDAFKISVKDLFKFYHSPQLAKLAFNKELDQAAYNIIQGDYELVQFRNPILELMQFIFDTPVRKMIREVDKWYK